MAFLAFACAFFGGSCVLSLGTLLARAYPHLAVRYRLCRPEAGLGASALAALVAGLCCVFFEPTARQQAFSLGVALTVFLHLLRLAAPCILPIARGVWHVLTTPLAFGEGYLHLGLIKLEFAAHPDTGKPQLTKVAFTLGFSGLTFPSTVPQAEKRGDEA